MEATFENNGTSDVFKNDINPPKTGNMDNNVTVPADMFVKSEADDCDEIKTSFSDSNDIKLLDEPPKPAINNNEQFEDDFGPETDVDTLDDTNIAKAELHTNNFESDTDITNGVKQFSLENKIIQHFSEQNKDFLTGTNPFSSDDFVKYHDHLDLETELLEQSNSEKVSAELMVDNKIIDALESLGITNGEKEKYEINHEKDDHELTDTTSKIPDMLDYTEKVDYTHEKHVCVTDSDTEILNESKFNQATDVLTQPIDENIPHENQDLLRIDSDAAFVVGSVGEDSEDEDEWNYIKGDKKSEEHLEIPTVALDLQQDSAADVSLSTEPTEHITEKNIDSSTLLQNYTSFDSTHSEGEGKLTTNNIFDGPEGSSQLQKLQSCQQKNSGTASKEPLESNVDKIDPNILKTTALLLVDEITEKEVETKIQEKGYDSETLEEPKNVNEDILNEESQKEDLAIFKETLQRPNSLCLDMASKLNPEAKEFVPTGSPSRSDPASPATGAPPVLQNTYLMVTDDVIAQSPKKGGSMENINVPTESDFQNEMINRPHELEKTTEYTNGASDTTVRSHSPASELSYQEMNLKEAMQCDEKLDFDYNDEKLVTMECSSDFSNEKSVLGTCVKEENPMNMSFYEGRDEGLLSNNSDILNKIQTLPDVEDVIDQECDDVKNIIMEDKSILENKMVTADIINIEVESKIEDIVNTEAESHIIGKVMPEASNTEKNVDTASNTIQLANESISSEIGMETCDLLDKQDQLDDKLVDLECHTEEKADVASCYQNLVQCDETITASEEILQNDLLEKIVTPIGIIEPVQIDNAKPALYVASTPRDSKPLELDHNALTIEEKPQPKSESVSTIGNVEIVLEVSSGIEDSKHIPNELCSTAFDLPKTSKEPTEELKQSIMKSTASKATVGTIKTSKLLAPADKKTSTTSKPLAKPIAKSPIASKSTSTARKTASATTSAVSTSSSSKANSVNKSPTTGTSRPSLTNNLANKSTTEKKVLISTVKKPSISCTNAQSTTAAKKSSTITRSLPTKVQTPGTGVSARSSSVTLKATPASKTSAAPRSSLSAPSKTSTVTSRTSSTLSTNKPRSAISTSKTTDTSGSTIINKNTHVTTTTVKKTSSLQNSSLKVTSAPKTTVAGKTNSVTNRTSTITKPNTTSPAGMRKSNVIVSKKQSSSPMSKVGGKTLSVNKTPVEQSLNQNDSITTDNTKLVDITKQLTNDSNQLIRTNGIDTQMIVIDSAAD